MRAAARGYYGVSAALPLKVARSRSPPFFCEADSITLSSDGLFFFEGGFL